MALISRTDAENDLLACAAYLAESINSSDGRAAAMNVVVPRYLANGNVDLAAALADTVDDPFSRDKLLILVAEKCADLNDDEYALQLVDAIEDDGLCAQARERVALMKATKGEIEKARKVAAEIVHPDFVEAGIAVRQAADGDEQTAFSTIEAIEFAHARVLALQNIASADIEAEKFEKAAAALGIAVDSANEIEHDEEKIRALCDIGNLYVEAKRNDRAVETFSSARSFAELLDNTHRDFFLSNCALGFLYANSPDLAEGTLDLVTDKTQMASALLGFARDEWKKGEKDQAVGTLDEAYDILKSQREIETRDSRSRNALMASIAIQFAGFAKTERAVEIAQENNDIDERIAALTQIARILTVQREDELARQTVDTIPDEANRLSALIAVSDEKKKLGETEAAITLLNEIAELTETVQQPAARANVLTELAARFVAYEMPEKARSVGLQSIKTIGQIRDESSQAAAIASVGDVYKRSQFVLSDDEQAAIRNLIKTVAW